MGTHVDWKRSRQDFTEKGEPRWLVRIYEGAYRDATADELAVGADAQVYEREKVLREREVVLPAGSTDEDLRAYMNEELTKVAGKTAIPAQVTGGKDADAASAKVPVVVSFKEITRESVGA